MGLTGELDISLPDTWFVLDDNPATRLATAQADVDAWAGGEALLMPFREELVEILLEFGKDADEQGALLAALYWEPGEYGPTAANLTVLKGARTALASIEEEIAALTENLARPGETDRGPREVSEIKLPIGPAVRLRGLATAGGVTDEGALIIDITQVWIPLEGDPAMVVVSGTTPCLDVGDEIAGVIDTVAGTLRPA